MAKGIEHIRMNLAINGGGNGNIEIALHLGGQLLSEGKALLEFLLLIDKPGSPIENQLAIAGQGDTFAAAVKQRGAKLFFHIVHTFAEIAGLQVQGSGGLRNGAALNDLDKVL